MSKKINPGQMIDAIEDAFGELDLTKKQEISELHNIQKLMRPMLQFEAKRLEKRLGSDHSRIKLIQNRLKANLANIKALEVEEQISGIVRPEVSKDAVLIHGRITDEKRLGVGGITVRLVDKQDRVVASGLKKDTGLNGYYAFNISSEDLEGNPKLKKDKLFVAVFNEEGKLLSKSTRPIKLNAGDVKLVELSLSSKTIRPRRNIIRQPSVPSGAPKVKPKKEDALLETVKGINPARARALRNAGISSIRKFIEADDDNLKNILGNIDIKKMKKQANTLLK